MITQYENRGFLFVNRNAQGNQPNWKGKLTIDGKEDRLSAWIKRDKNGQEYISISRTPADEAAKFVKAPVPSLTASKSTDNEAGAGEIPF